jgi:DNA-binding transcriptional MerR regulator
MRIGELSRRSGVSVPTIKYYRREGLLPAGASTGPNQATYSQEHLHRLRLIRALIDVGGLTVAATRDVLAAVDNPGVVGHELLGVAHCAVAPARRAGRDTEQWRAARDEAAALVRRRGWLVSPDALALDQVADVLASMRTLELDELLAIVDRYADAAATVAEHDLGTVIARAQRVDSEEPDGPSAAGAQQRRALMVEAVVTGTVLGESLLAALRRLAQEDASARVFGFESTTGE